MTVICWNADPASSEAQDLVKRIQSFITENMYTCSTKILRRLGRMYSGGGDLTKIIDEYGGEGCGEFVDRAIRIYCDTEAIPIALTNKLN